MFNVSAITSAFVVKLSELLYKVYANKSLASTIFHDNRFELPPTSIDKFSGLDGAILSKEVPLIESEAQIPSFIPESTLNSVLTLL